MALFRQMQRAFQRRRWLLLLAVLPLFIPIQTIKPHYKLSLKMKLNPPDYIQTHIERMKWLSEQINILSSKELLISALRKADLSKIEIETELTFIKNNLNITIKDKDILNIELATTERHGLKVIANEIATIYLDAAAKERQAMQAEIYESGKQQLKSLNSELKEAKVGFDAARIALENFQEKRIADDTRQLKREISELKASLSKMRTVYTEEHPQIKEIVNQVTEKTEQLNNKQTILVEEHKRETILKDDYQRKGKLFDKLSERYNSLKKATTLPERQIVGNIISASKIIDVDIMKTKFLDLSGKLAVGIIIAFLAGSITASLDKTVWNENEIKRDLGIRTLSTIIKPKKRPASGLLLDYPKNPAVIKSFEILRSNIQFINLATPLKSILYSSLLKEGDLLAANLAISMTFIGGKVALINVNGKRKKYNRLLAAENTVGAASPHIRFPHMRSGQAGQAGREQQPFSFYDTVIKNLKILNIEDANTLEKQQLNDLMASLKEKFDVIIIDSPAIAESVPCATMASIVDGVLLGAAAKKTEREFLLRNYKILGEINARVLGVVLLR